MRWRYLSLHRRRHGGRLHRGGLRGEILCDDGGIDLGDGAVRQASPCLVPAEQRNANIAAQGQRLAIRAQGHLGAVDLAVAGIEHIAVLIFQTIALHVADEGDTEPGRVLAVVGALRTDPRACTARLGKQFRHHAFEDAVVIDDQHVQPGLAVLDLLPQARRGGLGRRRPSGGRPKGKARDKRQQSPKSEGQIPHRCHLDQSVEFNGRLQLLQTTAILRAAARIVVGQLLQRVGIIRREMGDITLRRCLTRLSGRKPISQRSRIVRYLGSSKRSAQNHARPLFARSLLSFTACRGRRHSQLRVPKPRLVEIHFKL